MAQRIVNGEQYEALLIQGDASGGAIDIEGEVDVDGLQGASAFSITPSDNSDLSSITTALYVGFTGNLNIICSGDTTPVIFYNVPGGSFVPLQVKRVRASGTTASGIIGIL